VPTSASTSHVPHMQKKKGRQRHDGLMCGM